MSRIKTISLFCILALLSLAVSLSESLYMVDSKVGHGYYFVGFTETDNTIETNESPNFTGSIYLNRIYFKNKIKK